MNSRRRLRRICQVEKAGELVKFCQRLCHKKEKRVGQSVSLTRFREVLYG